MRREPRFYVPFSKKEGAISFERDQLHHLVHVLRVREGERIRVFNEHCGEWTATVHFQGKTLVAEREQQVQEPKKRHQQTWLAFGVLKPACNHVVVEKATELDATHIQPLWTERTQRKEVALEKWGLIARDAAQQCERLDVPTLLKPLTLQAFLQSLPEGQWFSAIERLAPEVTEVQSQQESRGDEESRGDGGNGGNGGSRKERGNNEGALRGIIIGPEGGWTDPEKEALIQQTTPMSFGENILRAETAAIVGLVKLLC